MADSKFNLGDIVNLILDCKIIYGKILIKFDASPWSYGIKSNYYNSGFSSSYSKSELEHFKSRYSIFEYLDEAIDTELFFSFEDELIESYSSNNINNDSNEERGGLKYL